MPRDRRSAPPSPTPLPTFALDTASPSLSLAVLDEDEPVAELWLGAVPGGGRRVLEAAHSLLGAAGVGVADLDGVLVGVGPGGFTGLRIGIATALGLGQACGIEVRGASSLEAMALALADAAPGAHAVVPMLDARRRELFTAAYRPLGGSGLEELIPPTALSPGALRERLHVLGDPSRIVVGGAGHAAAGDALGGFRIGATSGPEATPRARDLGRRAAAGATRPVAPVYARLPDAEVNRRARDGQEGAA